MAPSFKTWSSRFGWCTMFRTFGLALVLLIAVSCEPSARQEADKLFAQMKYAQAAERYAPLVAQDDAPLEVRRNYALSLAWSGKVAEARPLLETLRKETKDDEVLAAYIDSVALSGGVDEAAALIDSALGQFPRSATVHRAAGTVLAQQGKLDAALDQLNRALDIDPELAAAHANLGDIAYVRGDIRGALKHYRQAVLFEPGSPMSVRVRVRMAQLIMDSNPEEALLLLEEARMLEPEAPDVLAELGKVSGTQGMYDQCIQYLKQAHEVMPERKDILSTLGYCFLLRARFVPEDTRRRKDLLAAKLWLQKLLEKAPVYKGANNNLGQVLLMLGDQDAAEVRFKKELEAYPGSVEALTNLGRLMADRGEVAQAIALLEKAFSVDRSEVILASELGRLHFQSGDYPAAYKWYQTAYTLCHETLLDHSCRREVPYQLARLAAKSGDQDAAVTYFLQAVNGGFRDFGRARAEVELRGLRKDPRVARLLDSASH